MKDAILGICIGIVATFFLSPYFSLWYLKDIADNLEVIADELKKIEKKERSK